MADVGRKFEQLKAIVVEDHLHLRSGTLIIIFLFLTPKNFRMIPDQFYESFLMSISKNRQYVLYKSGLQQMDFFTTVFIEHV